MARRPEWAASPAKLRKTFGENLREARQKAGLTQAQVAEATGQDRAYVSHVERGVHNVTIETMAEMARVVKRSVADLLKPKQKKRMRP
jgi:transcriptional regulator with XRE-family HTH domain